MSSRYSENSLDDQVPLSPNRTQPEDLNSSQFQYSVTINPKKQSSLDNNKSIRVFNSKNHFFISFFSQTRFPAFSFFLIVMFLEMIPSISLSEGYPITGLPLLLVFIIQMIYEFFQGRLIESISRPHNEAKVNFLIFFFFKY